MLEKLLRLCIYWDSQLWDNKVTETNWYYNGLVLDYYFDNSVLAIDYLNIEDYFWEYGVCYVEEKRLEEQLQELEEDMYLIFVELVLNIFKYSKYDEMRTDELLRKSEAYLERQGFLVVDKSSNPIEVRNDNEIGKGSYCRVVKFAEAVVKKELLQDVNDTI